MFIHSWGMCWFLHKYAQVQQQTNLNMNKIILYTWIFADVIFQPGGHTVAMAWVTQKKVLAVDCKNSFSRKKPCQRFLRDNFTATFCTQNSWVNLFYPQYKAVQQMHVIWKTVLRYGIMRPNSRSRNADDLVPGHFVGRSVPTSSLPEKRCALMNL